MNNIRSGNTVQWTDTTANPPIIHKGIISSGPIVCYRVFNTLGNKIQLVEKMNLTVIDSRSNNNNNKKNNKERKNRKTRKLRR
jgi:hypothetical protein